MKTTELNIPGLYLIELDVHGDERGFFVERFHQQKFMEMGVKVHFAQINHSRSAPGVLRGLHYQTEPMQEKLVGVVRGRIWDVALDLRKGSKTYGQHYGVELTDMNGKMLLVPHGFAHGFCVLGEAPADVIYYTDSFYNPEKEGGIMWDDKELKIHWPIEQPKISVRDQQQSSWQEFVSPF